MEIVLPSIKQDSRKGYNVRYVKKHNGERKEWKRSGIKTLREAKKIKEGFVVEASRWIEEQESGFKNWYCAVQKYADSAGKSKSEATMDTELQNIKRYTSDWFGLSLSALDSKFVRSDLKIKFRDVKDVTRQSIVKHIRSVFAYLVNEGAINYNPLTGFTCWAKKIEKPALTCLTREQTVQLFKEAYKRNHPFKDIWHVAYGMGLRSGEAMGLKWDDIDWVNGTAFVQRAAIKNNRKRMGPPKGGKPRHVAIYPQLLQRLRATFEEKSDDWVLPYLNEWRNGKAASVLKSFQRELGLPETRLHDLRAAFITQLLESGDVGLSTVKALVGHVRTETTDRYVRNSAVRIVGKTKAIELTGVIDVPSDEPNWEVIAPAVNFMDELENL